MKARYLLPVMMLALVLALLGCKQQEDAELAPAAESLAQEVVFDQADPEGVVKAYFEAWQAGDAEGVMALTMKGLQVKEEGKEALIKEYQGKMAEPKLANLKIISSKVEGDEATFELTMEANGKEGPATAKLNLVDGKWYVDD